MHSDAGVALGEGIKTCVGEGVGVALGVEDAEGVGVGAGVKNACHPMKAIARTARIATAITAFSTQTHSLTFSRF